MKTSSLSVVLATRNEEANLDRCLESVRDLADEIIVVDESSSDKTISIAKKFHAKVSSVPHQENFHLTKNIAISQATKDWVLQLDADEVVSPSLAREIKTILSSHPPENGFWLNRRNWFLSRFLTKGGQYPDPTIRLYRRGKGQLPAKDVHEQAQVTGQLGHLTSDLLHYRDTSFAKYLQGFSRYSSFIAFQLQDQGKSINLFDLVNYLLLKPFSTFFLIYFRHLGLVDGLPGLIFAFFSGLIHPVAYLKFITKNTSQ